MELKRLFQGSLSLEDFHTKALRLVQQAGYEGDAKDRVLRDTTISGLASDKIRAKIVKEGHGVNLNRVMEIARLEVSTQQHLEQMQETAKVNYVQYGKSTKSKKKEPQSSAGAGGHRGSRPSGKFNKRPPLLPDTCYRCGKGRHQKAQDCKAVDATCRGCGKKGHYEKVCLQGKCSAHSLETPQANSAGAGASEPLYFNDEGQPVYTYMVSVPHANRIGKFPGMPYKFQLKENAKPVGHAPRKVPIHLQDAFHKEIRNLEKLGILEETKDVTEWVNSFVIVEKKTPASLQPSPAVKDTPRTGNSEFASILET